MPTIVLFADNVQQLPDRSVSEYMQVMPVDVQNKISRFYKWQDSQATLIGRILLAWGGKEYFGVSDMHKSVEYTEFGRPYCRTEGLDFNISHSGGRVVCCISDYKRVGLDVEQVVCIRTEEFESQFTADELRSIKDASDPTLLFYDLWTSKEAIIKADGKGLSLPLKKVRVSADHSLGFIDEQMYYLRKVDVGLGYHCCVAINGVVTDGFVCRKVLNLADGKMQNFSM